MEKDQSIMQELYRIGYRDKALIRINRLRNFHQVIYLSDIMEGNGAHIRKEMMQGGLHRITQSNFTRRKEYPSKQDLLCDKHL